MPQKVMIWVPDHFQDTVLYSPRMTWMHRPPNGPLKKQAFLQYTKPTFSIKRFIAHDSMSWAMIFCLEGERELLARENCRGTLRRSKMVTINDVECIILSYILYKIFLNLMQLTLAQIIIDYQTQSAVWDPLFNRVSFTEI